jgi:hypothetical protein
MGRTKAMTEPALRQTPVASLLVLASNLTRNLGVTSVPLRSMTGGDDAPHRNLKGETMGLFDKLKSAVNAVTGGAAKVTLEFQPQTAFPGEPLNVRVTVTSTGGELKSGGIFLDVQSTEHVALKKGAAPNVHEPINVSNTTFTTQFPIAPAFVLAPNETKAFDGAIQFPHGAPTYEGPCAEHAWTIRGRVEAFGNDPDSGFLPIRVGMKM